MKRFFIAFAMLFGSIIFSKDRTEERILKLVAPYQDAISFIADLDSSHKVNDHDVFMFFNRNGLYEKKDIKKLKNILSIVKRLAYSEKFLYKNHQNIEALIDGLEEIKAFATTHGQTYYALITYYEIAARYYYIDQENSALVAILMEQHERFGLPNMQGRGLYKFVKKIDLDMRRLTALFSHNIVSDDLVVKMNQMKTKLIMLKNRILSSTDYKVQQSKTRWLKAFGVLIIPVLMTISLPFFLANCGASQAIAFVYPTIYFSGLLFACIGITAQEFRESNKYNIPVHSNSLFSLFRPTFFPLTWTARG